MKRIPWNKGKKGVQVAWNKGIKTGVVPWNKGTKGLVKANKGSFMKGQTAINPFQKGHATWNRGMVGFLAEERNAGWKGEEVGYVGLHKWVRKYKGEAKECSKCAVKAEEKVLHYANVDRKYRRNLDDFIALCVSCHKKHDLALLGHLQ